MDKCSFQNVSLILYIWKKYINKVLLILGVSQGNIPSNMLQDH